MIDFGIIALFSVMCIMVAAVYHVWNRISGEIRDVKSMKEDIRQAIEAGRVASSTMAAIITEVNERVAKAEAIPAALSKRVMAVEDAIRDGEKNMLVLGDRITSVGNRLSSNLRKGKKREEDADPAPQGEDAERPSAEPSPGSLFESQEPPPPPGIPQGFGVLKRRVG